MKKSTDENKESVISLGSEEKGPRSSQYQGRSGYVKNTGFESKALSLLYWHSLTPRNFLDESEDLGLSAFLFTDSEWTWAQETHIQQMMSTPFCTSTFSQRLHWFLGGTITIYRLLVNVKAQSQQSCRLYQLCLGSCVGQLAVTHSVSEGRVLSGDRNNSVWGRHGRGKKCVIRMQYHEILTFPRTGRWPLTSLHSAWAKRMLPSPRCRSFYHIWQSVK